MLRPDGAPFVPETCPQHVVGDGIPSLYDAVFELSIHTTPKPVSGVVELNGSFITGDPESDAGHSRVETGVAVEQLGSPLGRALVQFANDAGASPNAAVIYSEEHPRAERMRQLFCERAATCPGLVDGQCWALGETGLRTVVDQVLQPNAEENC